MLAAMTLRPRHPVQQGLQQKNVIPVTMNTTDMMNTEDSGFIGTSAVRNLPAQEEASCNENDESVMSDEVSGTTETPAVRHLLRTMNTEDGSPTETSAVWNLPAQEASCVMSEGISDTTEAHTVQCLSA